MPVRDRSAPMLLVKLRSGAGEDFRVVTDRVLSFKYTDSDRKADVAKLTVDNFDLSNFDDPAWRKGGTLVVQWGYPGAMTPAREVVITSVKGFTTLQVEAEAKSVVMNRRVKNRTFRNKTISQIVTDIAKESGFGEDQRDIDATDEVHDTVTQSRLTDAQFLRRWASKLGFEWYVDFDGFHFHERRLGQRPVRVLTYHTDPSIGDILEGTKIENDITAKPARSRVKGRDPVEKKDIDEVADNASDDDRRVLSDKIELVDPDTGVTDTVVLNHPVTENHLASEEVVPTADSTAASAKKKAQGRFRRAQQTAIKMTVPIIGDPLLLAKTVVQVQGMGKRLSVRYYVKEMEHDLSPDGYTSRASLISDGHGGHATDSVVARGLSLFGAGRQGAAGGAGEPGQSGALLAALQRVQRAALQAGDQDSAQMVESALQAYQRVGNQARDQALRVLRAVMARAQAQGNTDLLQAAGSAFGVLQQQGDEIDSGGRPNREDAQADGGALVPVERVDPDTGITEIVYRQRGKG